MEDEIAAVPQPPTNLVVRLPPFWPTNPAAWFANADGQFALRGITCQRARYYNALTALPETTVNLIADLVEGAVPDDAYDQLKSRLAAAHTLTDYQKVEALFALPPLGGRKPSEMLSEMVRLCPRGQEDSVFFTYCFLHRLPRELRVLLTDVDHTDRRALSLRADDLWAHSARSAHDSPVAAVAADPAEEEAVAAAVRAPVRGRGGRARGGRSGGARGRGSFQASNNNRGGASGSNGAQAAAMTPSAVAREGSDLCHYHWSYGDNARKCVAPCSWQGN
jgi:hypothetical protein